MSRDLHSLGMSFDTWQEAVEAAIATNQLSVIGELNGGQLVQYGDASGALITILAVEPFATFAGFQAETQTFGNVTMLNDVLAFCEVLDPRGKVMTAVTANLVQGPLLAELPTQEWQQLGITALTIEHAVYESAQTYEAQTGQPLGMLLSEGAQVVAAGNGSSAPDAAAQFSARVLEAEYRHNQLTGQRFIHAIVDGAFPFDVCLPDSPQLPAKDSVIAGTAVMTAMVLSPVGGGCGGCGGSCGCS
ncbi:hypothetical protein [Corynebacterium tapiri]|uniref:Uncharacterized protein n=1 Tax=Corynebacterium tapiri TaxID=1448266 RepID=A0A5C4U635_9CORY|nr:hypothetical protein [Corynebacterium tapiri]TNL99224.1 hypothetical protein FHE74_02380 [Corynebacterium tapiri]